MPNVKDASGRFTGTYDPAYCAMVPEIMSQGYSIAAVAREAGVSLKTIYNWKAAHPEFAEALELGNALAVAWWEDALRSAALSGSPSTPIIFGLKNRAPELWSDTTKTEHTGKDGGAMVIIGFRD
jgi:lambda repressor-like predicted transcriptional regulator